MPAAGARNPIESRRSGTMRLSSTGYAVGCAVTKISS
jgi:hypothetical protein